MSLTFTTNPSSSSYRQNELASALTAVATADTGVVDYIWEYSSNNSTWTVCNEGLFDLTDGINPIVDNQGASIQGYDQTYDFSGNYIPSTASIGVLYYRCRARKTASGGVEETAYSTVATITITQATVPIITAFSYSKNPCNTEEVLLITATVTEG